MSNNNKSEACGPDLSLTDKSIGAFLALAAGDALGWPQEVGRNVSHSPANQIPSEEFREWTRRGGGRFLAYEEIVHAGDYSDDTQLALAVARSRINHASDWWRAFTLAELPFWILYERGGGSATKRAVKAWSAGRPPWKLASGRSTRAYFDAGGNGVAMRVLPHALFFGNQESSADLVRDVILDGLATHGHPRALVGAAAYAYAAWWLLRRDSTLRFGELLDVLIDEKSKWGNFPETVREESTWFRAAYAVTDGQYEKIWESVVQEMSELFETARQEVSAGALADDSLALKKLGCFGRERGSGTRSTAAAAYLTARHAAQPWQGVLRAAFEKGADTDTLAGMTGGLMGCLAGTEWIPRPWFKVQDAEYIQRIAGWLISEPKEERRPRVEFLPDRQSILSKLDALNGNGENTIDLGRGNQATATLLSDMKPVGKSVTIRRWRLKTSDGQTLYVRKVSKISARNLPERVEQPAHLTRPAVDRSTILSPEVQSPGSHLYLHLFPEEAAGKPQATVHKITTIPARSKRAGKPGSQRNPKLYLAFCKELSRFLKESSGQAKLLEVQNRLKLERKQVQVWMDQAEKDGLIRKTKKRPLTYELLHTR